MTLVEGVHWMWSGKGLRRPHWATQTKLCAHMGSNRPYVLFKGKDLIVRKVDFKPTVADILAYGWEVCAV